jgi:hypothetical protein
MMPLAVIAFPLEPLGADEGDDQVEHHAAGPNRKQDILHLSPYTFSNAQIDAVMSANRNTDTTIKTTSGFNASPLSIRAPARPSDTAAHDPRSSDHVVTIAANNGR